MKKELILNTIKHSLRYSTASQFLVTVVHFLPVIVKIIIRTINLGKGIHLKTAKKNDVIMFSRKKITDGKLAVYIFKTMRTMEKISILRERHC